MKNIGKKITECVKKLLIFFGWGVVGILALIDGWMGDDVFFKTLMSAISAITLIAIAIILYKEGRNFFRNIALPSVFGALQKYANAELKSKIKDTPNRIASIRRKS